MTMKMQQNTCINRPTLTELKFTWGSYKNDDVKRNEREREREDEEEEEKRNPKEISCSINGMW